MYNANLYSVEQYYSTDKFTVRLNGKVLESDLPLETARNLVESKIQDADDYKELMNDQKTLMTGPEFRESRAKTREQNAQAAQSDKSWYYQDAYGNTVCGNGVQMKTDNKTWMTQTFERNGQKYTKGSKEFKEYTERSIRFVQNMFYLGLISEDTLFKYYQEHGIDGKSI